MKMDIVVDLSKSERKSMEEEQQQLQRGKEELEERERSRR
jgi:hypothetical protein